MRNPLRIPAIFSALCLTIFSAPSSPASSLIADASPAAGVSIFSARNAFNLDIAEEAAGEEEPCFRVEVLKDLLVRPGALSLAKKIFIDPEKGCVIKMKIFTESDAVITIGGYSYTGETGAAPMKREDGRVWTFNLQKSLAEKRVAVFKGPLDGWTPCEVTIHPSGSDLEPAWLPHAISFRLNIWITAPVGSILYIKDISVDEVNP